MGNLTAVYANDFDLSALGLIVESPGGVEGLWHAPSTRDRTTQLPTRVGAVLLAPEAETAPRQITINGVIKRASVALVGAALLELQERLYRGTIELRFADDPDKFVLARVTDVDGIGVPPQFVNPSRRVVIRATCPDPLIYARYPSVVGFSSVKAAIPLGSAVSAPELVISGTTANPVVTYRNMAGDVKQTMGFTVTLGANDYLVVDCDLCSVKRYTAGVESNGIALLSSGSFVALDPQDGDVANSVYPTLEINGTNIGEARFRRAWL